MKIKIKTPNRVDFAGGTLDLYPVYLFMDGGLTVNGAISIYSCVEIETRQDSRFVIRSVDQEKNIEYNSMEDFTYSGATGFIELILKHYKPSTGLNITTHNQAPKGSGLGASSALLMAVSAGLDMVEGRDVDLVRMIDAGANIEAAHLGIPTGKQDYYGAVLGKIHALKFDVWGCHPEELVHDENFKKEMSDALIVSFTGISHFSGTNNWDMFKKAIDKVGTTWENLVEIKKIAGDIRQAFLEKDMEKIGDCISREWECRKHLSTGVSNKFINSAIDSANRAGGWGSKLCGAGGGGCMITLAQPGKYEDVIESLKSSGVEILPARLDFQGLRIEREGGETKVFSPPLKNRLI